MAAFASPQIVGKLRKPIHNILYEHCQGTLLSEFATDIVPAMYRQAMSVAVSVDDAGRNENLGSTFYEFFAGGGMARAGLGDGWRCLFANDFDQKKGRVYRENWGDAELRVQDVREVATKDLPGVADLVWASFPCQDLSLAGSGAGLNGDRSGTFWPFWSLMRSLMAEGRAPRLIVLENVCGTLTSNDGKDFAAICDALEQAGYRFGAMVIDAAAFLPHSRPRLFVIAVREQVSIPKFLLSELPITFGHTRTLRITFDKLPPHLKRSWLWWNIPAPPKRSQIFADLIEDEPTSVGWHTPEETHRLLSMMSEVNMAKLEAAKGTSGRMVGGVYKRTRLDGVGRKVQRAEIRFDGLAGCLRTPAGGSSRQLIVVVDGPKVRSRLISSREAARLMGLPDEYRLPENYSDAYHLTGDGVVAPVVRHLAVNVFETLLRHDDSLTRAAA